jgi:hypothetical protein
MPVTQEIIEKAFNSWWDSEGKELFFHSNLSIEEAARIAWKNGAYLAEFSEQYTSGTASGNKFPVDEYPGLQSELWQFKEHWTRMTAKHPKKYPKELPLEEWEEQFFEYLGLDPMGYD